MRSVIVSAGKYLNIKRNNVIFPVYGYRLFKILIPKEQDKLVTLSGQTIYKRRARLLEKNNLPHMTFHDLRHVNASVMAMLRIPDKYAQEHGGWKTDKVMKTVYQQAFSEKRERVDSIIDEYFSNKMQHEMQHK